MECKFCQNALLPKAGLEQFDNLVRGLKIPMHDLKKVFPTFNSAAWLFGLGIDYQTTDVLSSSAGQVRLLSMGQTAIRMTRCSELRKHMKIPNDDVIPHSATTKMFASLTVARFTELKAAGLDIFSVTLSPSELLVIPPGFVVSERVIKGPLVYGIRKSFFVDAPSAGVDLKAVIEGFVQDGRNADRLSEVMSSFTTVAPAVAAVQG